MPEVTYEQWEAKGRELFGDDMSAWRFICPSCRLEMSAQRVRSQFAEHLPKLRAGDFRLEQECIGRHLPGVGCNWAAYGLLHGPVFVVDAAGSYSGRQPVFDFAGRPFTGPKVVEDSSG